MTDSLLLWTSENQGRIVKTQRSYCEAFIILINISLIFGYLPEFQKTGCKHYPGDPDRKTFANLINYTSTWI